MHETTKQKNLCAKIYDAQPPPDSTIPFHQSLTFETDIHKHWSKISCAGIICSLHTLPAKNIVYYVL